MIQSHTTVWETYETKMQVTKKHDSPKMFSLFVAKQPKFHLHIETKSITWLPDMGQQNKAK